MGTLTHDQAVEIQSRFETGVLQLPGVTGVDVGPRTVQGVEGAGWALRVYVAARATAPQLPASFEGLPVEVIERSFGLQRR